MQTKDFKGQDLRGRSFKNQDLTGADFSDCDLRGVDFSFANLTAAKFCNAKMGRTKKVAFVLLLFQLLLGVITGFIVVVDNVFMFVLAKEALDVFALNSDSSNEAIFVVIYSALFAAVLVLATLRQRFDYVAWFYGLLIVGVATTVAATPSPPPINEVSETLFLAVARAVVVAGATAAAALAAALAVTLAVVTIIAVAGGVVAAVVAIATTIAIAIATTEAVDVTVTFILATIVYFIAGIYLGWRANKREESQLLLLRNCSAKMACFRGTQFAFAILHDIDFSSADLKYARFKNAKITDCNFKNTKNHHLALTENTSLEPRKVRDLVIDGIISDKNFATLDLRGLDFSNLNLQDFNFSHADLSGANLSHTQLTGATLEGWNIDTETRLDDIDCRYYYYLENGAKKRMPPEGEEYSPGEFSRIFQKIANTIDFIAHNEMELAAIKLSVEQVRVESGNDDIRVQAIEEKDGFIVVKVTVPKTEDRGVLYHEVNVLKQEYEAKIQGLMAEKQIQIGKIEVLKEQIKEQRDDFLAAIKDGRIIHATNYIEGNMNGGNVAGKDIQN